MGAFQGLCGVGASPLFYSGGKCGGYSPSSRVGGKAPVKELGLE